MDREISVRVKEKYRRHNPDALSTLLELHEEEERSILEWEWAKYLMRGGSVRVRVLDDEHVTISGVVTWHLSAFDIVKEFNIGDRVKVRGKAAQYLGHEWAIGAEGTVVEYTEPDIYNVRIDPSYTIPYFESSLEPVDPGHDNISKYADNTHSWDDWDDSVLLNDPGTPTHAEDEVTNPDHYTSHPSGIEAIDVCEHMNFNLGNVIKYIWRAGKKGDTVTDLLKARWYINREIERMGGDIGSK